MLKSYPAKLDGVTLRWLDHAPARAPVKPVMVVIDTDLANLYGVPTKALNQAANVLASPQAVEMGVYVVRAFVRLREVLASNRELAAGSMCWRKPRKHWPRNMVPWHAVPAHSSDRCSTRSAI